MMPIKGENRIAPQGRAQCGRSSVGESHSAVVAHADMSECTDSSICSQACIRSLAKNTRSTGTGHRANGRDWGLGH